MSTSLLALRAAGEANSAERTRQIEKKRNILVLINAYLIENGYIESAERLQSEAGQIISKFDVADNVDLGLILSDYEAYYEMRFDKKPKLVRKTKEGEEGSRGKQKAAGAGANAARAASSSSSATAKKGDVKAETKMGDDTNGTDGFGVSGTSLGGSSVSVFQSEKRSEQGDGAEETGYRLLKPPPHLGANSEMKQLFSIISKEIYQESPNVRFADIVQLTEAKRLLAEAVQLPLRFPTIFTGILRPWRGILLHGPPGTGKTMLAKAVATECQTTFFNISASTLVSKWRGDSEKLVRALFDLARHHAPSTIFLDEIDSILSSRTSDANEHEASRRMKTELLIQMDGLVGGKIDEQIFVMAASNTPWDLDIALLRRLEKRVYVPLPEEEARGIMLRKHLSDRCVDIDKACSEVAGLTSGYSGADIELLCREAAMKPVRRLMIKLSQLEDVNAVPLPPNPRNSRTSLRSTESVDISSMLKSDPVTLDDIISALESTKSSSSNAEFSKYEDWQKEYGAV